jgi:diguanylate cyclase (GGDEF)-like protein
LDQPVDRESTPDPANDMTKLRRAVESLGAGSDAVQALDRLERASKTQRLDFASFLEMAGRINAQGLDLDRIESYVTSLLRGRTGAAAVSLLRASAEEGVLVTTRGPTLRLELASALAKNLTALGRPVAASELGGDAAFFAKAAIVAPLVQQDSGERVLRGVLVLGKKITGAPYAAHELEFLGLISELVAIALHNAFLHYTATHDALTETWSRGYFDVELKREVSRAQRRRAKPMPASFSLVMIDLDHFKRVNDTYGHRAGDRVLTTIAATLRRTIRDYDTLARWGGEEFVVVLPDVAKPNALEAAERFRKAIRETPVAVVDGGEAIPHVTASFGVASFPDDGEDPRELLLKADAALYRSKESGRDRVTGA